MIWKFQYNYHVTVPAIHLEKSASMKSGLLLHPSKNYTYTEGPVKSDISALYNTNI